MFPRQIGCEDACPEAIGRAPCTSHACHDFGSKLDTIPRGTASRIARDLGPNKFGWIEFRCGRREVKDMQTRMTRQEILDETTAMNRMLVPEHHDRTGNATEQMLQKDNDFLAAE